MIRWFCLVLFLGTVIGGGAGYAMGTRELREDPAYRDGPPDSGELIPRTFSTFGGLIVGFFAALVGFVELTGLYRRLSWAARSVRATAQVRGFPIGLDRGDPGA